MANKVTRFTLAVPNDLAQRAQALKQDAFYSLSYAKMYRQLILLGMEMVQQEELKEQGESEGSEMSRTTINLEKPRCKKKLTQAIESAFESQRERISP